ncbi:hypothetical protein C3L33_22758, partial [Rhododendron williamsianum]
MNNMQEFVLNSRGMKFFTCRWLPANCEPKALIFLCHGYAMESSISMKGNIFLFHGKTIRVEFETIPKTPYKGKKYQSKQISSKTCEVNWDRNKASKTGYGVYGMDYEGHGKSSGLQGYVPNFDEVVTDCSDHYTRISGYRKKSSPINLPTLRGRKTWKIENFDGRINGRSSGTSVHRKKPPSGTVPYWLHPCVRGTDRATKGLIGGGCGLFSGRDERRSERQKRGHPMPEVRQSPEVDNGTSIADDVRPPALVVNVLTKLCRIIPTWKIIPTPDIIDVACRDPEVRQEVSIPFLIVHGVEDKVTDPSVSNLLYESACSKDKSFKLYPGMWHSLTYGELPENIDVVFEDVTSWLDDRVAMRETQLEHEQKFENDELLKGKSVIETV